MNKTQEEVINFTPAEIAKINIRKEYTRRCLLPTWEIDRKSMENVRAHTEWELSRRLRFATRDLMELASCDKMIYMREYPDELKEYSDARTALSREYRDASDGLRTETMQRIEKELETTDYLHPTVWEENTELVAIKNNDDRHENHVSVNPERKTGRVPLLNLVLPRNCVKYQDYELVDREQLVHWHIPQMGNCPSCYRYGRMGSLCERCKKPWLRYACAYTMENEKKRYLSWYLISIITVWTTHRSCRDDEKQVQQQELINYGDGCYLARDMITEFEVSVNDIYKTLIRINYQIDSPYCEIDEHNQKWMWEQACIWNAALHTDDETLQQWHDRSVLRYTISDRKIEILNRSMICICDITVKNDDDIVILGRRLEQRFRSAEEN